MNVTLTIELSKADRARLDAVLSALETSKRDMEHMNLKLQMAVAALVQTSADEKVELTALQTFIAGQPDVIAAAVSKALAEHDVDDEDAADTIEAARADAKAAVDSAFASLPGNDTISGGGDTSTLSGGLGDDTINGGNGTDTLVSGNGADTLGDNTGGQVVTGDPGAPSTTIDPSPASIPPDVPEGAN